MLNTKWQTIRVPLLAIVFGGTLLVWAKLVTTPKESTNRLVDSVPLPEWQFLSSQPVSNSEAKFGRQYRYQKGNLSLTAQQYYMESDGDVSRYLLAYSPVKAANTNLVTKYHPQVGHYGLVTHQGQAYLSSCINPRGSSTVTTEQFTQNRYAHDLQLSRILPWMLGQTSLLDYRCLWTVLAIPLKSTSGSSSPTPETAYKNLELIWFSWHQWWQVHFPPQ